MPSRLAVARTRASADSVIPVSSAIAPHLTPFSRGFGLASVALPAFRSAGVIFRVVTVLSAVSLADARGWRALPAGFAAGLAAAGFAAGVDLAAILALLGSTGRAG